MCELHDLPGIHYCRECGDMTCDRNDCLCSCFRCDCPCHGDQFVIHGSEGNQDVAVQEV